MIKILKQDEKLYDSLSLHPLQSVSWGKAREKMGIRVIRLAQTKKNRIDRIYQMTIHKVPLTPYRIGYVPRSQMPSGELINFLKKWGNQNNIIFVKFEPYEKKTKTNEKFFSQSVFNKSKHPLFPSWTQILNCTSTEEEILKNMHPKTRYNIRLSSRKGVVVKQETSEKGFNNFIKLYFETAKRQKYLGHDENYHKIVWDNLKGKIAHILTAYYQDLPLASFEFFFFNQKLYYVYGGTSLTHRNLMAANLVMWEGIRLAKQLKAKELDMWGSLPPGYDQSHSWSGFTRFKEGYGTEFVEMIGSYDLVIKPKLYRFYGLSHKIREIILRLFV